MKIRHTDLKNDTASNKYELSYNCDAYQIGLLNINLIFARAIEISLDN